MAITPTGAIFKTLSFDGESLRSYGVYISGEATFNAPAREVEMISIPGRSGQLALDKGRFENIEVTYPAGIYADTEEDFAEAVSELRNFLCSRSGYCRIEDDYNPNEFRMGIYKSGLEVTPALLKAGEFDLVFDCKPQRWLKSGEDEISVQDGDTITNPTLFESSPLLEVEGSGTINFNSFEIELIDQAFGSIVLASDLTVSSRFYNYDPVLVNSGDSVTFTNPKFEFLIYNDYGPNPFTGIYNKTSSGAISADVINVGSTLHATVECLDVNTTVGAEGVLLNAQVSCEVTTDAGRDQFILGIALKGTQTGVELTYSMMVVNVPGYNTFPFIAQTESYSMHYDQISAISTASLLGHPTYVDCDLGEAYKYIGGEFVSLNRYIDLGSELPRLAIGNNTFAFDNTITDLKVIPRWWKI